MAKKVSKGQGAVSRFLNKRGNRRASDSAVVSHLRSTGVRTTKGKEYSEKQVKQWANAARKEIRAGEAEKTSEAREAMKAKGLGHRTFEAKKDKEGNVRRGQQHAHGLKTHLKRLKAALKDTDRSVHVREKFNAETGTYHYTTYTK